MKEFWFIVFVIAVHSYIWKNTDIPSELFFFPFLLSLIASILLVSIVGWFIGVIKSSKLKDNIAWQPLVFVLCIVVSLLGQCLPQTATPAPRATATSYLPKTVTPWHNTIEDSLTEQAQDEQILIWETHETQTASASGSDCLYIKGNISFDTGEKIYHLPGQEFYASTTIDTSAGERWFCTEAEARAAGWRKSQK